MSIQNNQLLFLDVSTTQNTLPDANLCPIEVSVCQFDLSDLYGKKKVSWGVHFFIEPDEKIMPAAEIQIGKTASEINGSPLEEGLRKIYEVTSRLRFNPAPCLIGYNLEYDIDSISRNMKRVFKDKDENLANFGEVLEVADKIDVMVMAKRILPPSKVGSYTMLNVAVCMYTLKVLEKIEPLIGSVRDNYLCKIIFSGLLKLAAKLYPKYDFSSVKGILKFMSEPQKAEVFPFGKYMNIKISEVAKKDPEYIDYIMRNAGDLEKRLPDLYYTLKNKLY